MTNTHSEESCKQHDLQKTIALFYDKETCDSEKLALAYEIFDQEEADKEDQVEALSFIISQMTAEELIVRICSDDSSEESSDLFTTELLNREFSATPGEIEMLRTQYFSVSAEELVKHLCDDQKSEDEKTVIAQEILRQASKEAPDKPAMSGAAQVVFIIFVLLGIYDYMGMHYNYDITGVSWSPMAFWVAGGLLAKVLDAGE